MGFLAPGILFLLPLALGALLYAYRRGGRAPPVVVSSVFLLRELARQVPAPQKIRPPLRMLIELLMVLLLLAAAAGAFLSDKNAEVLILMDNSLSMAARVSPAVGTNGGTISSVFDRAKEEALQELKELPFGARVSIWVTSPSVRSITPGFASISEAVEAVSGTRWVFGKDQLESAVHSVLTQMHPSRMVIFSDKRVRVTGEGLRTTQVEGRQIVPEAVGNVSISELKWIGADALTTDNANSRELEVEITQSDTESEGGTFKGQILLDRLDDAHDRFVPVKTEEIQIRKSETSYVRLAVPRTADVVRVSVRVGSDVSSRGRDSLREDNFAYARGVASENTIVVVGDLTSNELGLPALKNISVSVQTPEQYEQTGIPPGTQLAIFHRYAPKVLPDVATLIVAPSGQNMIFPVERSAQNARVTNWQVGHPLTRYISFAALTVPVQQVLRVPGWATEVFRTTAGPALYAGEQKGRRIAVIGIELFPFRAGKSPLLSVMFLNLIRWLTETGASPGLIAPYVPIPLGSDSSKAVLINSRDEVEGVETSDAGLAVPREPGVMISRTGKKGELLEVINFIDRDEAVLGRGEPLHIQISAASQASSERGLSLVEWCAQLALTLLLLDFLWRSASAVVRRRRSARSKAPVYAA